MNQREIIEAKHVDPRGGTKTREVAQQEANIASKTSQPILGEDKLSPWKFPRKED